VNKPAYTWGLVALLSFNFGVVYFDRNTLNFLMPLIQPELHLSNVQIGKLGSALALSWAVAGLAVGRLSDRLGRRKVILVVAALVFSGASALSAWVTTFGALMLTRRLMGLAEACRRPHRASAAQSPDSSRLPGCVTALPGRGATAAG